MATYPEIDKDQAQEAINAFLYQIMFETPEQKRDRTEREKVYALQRLNENLESQRRYTYPSWYSTWKSEPIKSRSGFYVDYCVVFISILILFVLAIIL